MHPLAGQNQACENRRGLSDVPLPAIAQIWNAPLQTGALPSTRDDVENLRSIQNDQADNLISRDNLRFGA